MDDQFEDGELQSRPPRGATELAAAGLDRLAAFANRPEAPDEPEDEDEDDVVDAVDELVDIPEEDEEYLFGTDDPMINPPTDAEMEDLVGAGDNLWGDEEAKPEPKPVVVQRFAVSRRIRTAQLPIQPARPGIINTRRV